MATFGKTAPHCAECGDRLVRDMALMQDTCPNVKCVTNTNPPPGYPPTMESKWDYQAKRWYEPGNPMHIQPTRDPQATEFTKSLGPIRTRTRDEIMADARRGHWNDIAANPPAPGETVIITRETRLDSGQWLLARYEPDLPWSTLYIYGLPATHWAKDTLGTP